MRLILSTLGVILMAIGVLAILLGFAGIELGFMSWFYALGKAQGWALKVAIIIFGYALWVVRDTDLTLNTAQFFDWPARTIGKLAGWFIVPLILIIMFDVVTRKIDFARIWIAEQNIYWFNPIIFQDAQWHLHGIIMLCSFGFGYLMNSHVRVDIFREMLPRRGQAKVEFWGLLIMGIPFLMVITYYALQFVALSYAQNEQSESLTGIGNRYLVKSFLIIGFTLLLFSFMATILRLSVAIWGPVQDRERAYGTLAIFAEQSIEDEIDEYKSDIAEHHKDAT